MDDAREILDWMEGFAKVASAHGVTDPPKVQQLIKLAWFLQVQAEDPQNFSAGFDAAMAEKKANKVTAGLRNVLARMGKGARRTGRVARNTALVGAGGLAAGGAIMGGGAVATGVADAVDQSRTRDLIEGITREKARPNIVGGSGLPYSGYRV